MVVRIFFTLPSISKHSLLKYKLFLRIIFAILFVLFYAEIKYTIPVTALTQNSESISVQVPYQRYFAQPDGNISMPLTLRNNNLSASSLRGYIDSQSFYIPSNDTFTWSSERTEKNVFQTLVLPITIPDQIPLNIHLLTVRVETSTHYHVGVQIELSFINTTTNVQPITVQVLDNLNQTRVVGLIPSLASAGYSSSLSFQTLQNSQWRITRSYDTPTAILAEYGMIDIT